jgi:hypothetical protein
MNKRHPSKLIKSLLLASFVVMAWSFSSAFAWGGGGGHGGAGFHGGGGYHGGWGFHNHYWGGYYGWGWYGYPGVVVAGYPYYYDGVYYSDYPGGSVVAVTEQGVSSGAVAPSQTAPPLPAVPKKLDGDTAVINIPSAGGKITSVKLTKYADGYIGPQGEYYAGHPTVAQLRVLYGN